MFHCDVEQGEKWLANLWIWNGPRHEFWEDAEGTINGKVGGCMCDVMCA